MDKYIFEKLDDNYINFYEEWIFARCIEYSAVEISKITDYKLYLNIKKPDNIVFLEIGFPKTKLEDITKKLEREWKSYRILSKKSEPKVFNWTSKIVKNNKEIVEMKKSIIEFNI